MDSVRDFETSCMSGCHLFSAISGAARARQWRLRARLCVMDAAFRPPTVPRWGGSVPNHRVIDRDREGAWLELQRRYFDNDPLFDDATFRRRFRMKRELFNDIYEKIRAKNDFFDQKADALGRMGFHGKHKMVVALRMLAYASIADALDDGYAMAESTVLQCVREFTETIIEVFEKDYLMPPTAAELSRILAENEARGFPGMIGSIDCMHWEWRACPVSWHSYYRGYKAKPTVILEAVATKDLRIWHAFFGMPGSSNDINVLQRSPVFDDLANGRTPPVNFNVNGNAYSMGYYLADGIYPDWATLVKSIPQPKYEKDINFAQAQESARKDVERVFGVLRSKFRIIQLASRMWCINDMNKIMRAYIILHNMIIESERGTGSNHHEFERPQDPPISQERHIPEIDELMKKYDAIQCKHTSSRLQSDLVEHLWHWRGNLQGRRT